MESLHTTDSAKSADTVSIDQKLFPDLPLDTLRRFGSFIATRDVENPQRTVLFIKHIHGMTRNADLMKEADRFQVFTDHQHAVFSSLRELSSHLPQGKKLSVVLEALEPNYVWRQGFLESVAAVQDSFDKGEYGVLGPIQYHMASKSALAADARLHLHGGVRFFAMEMRAGRKETVLPGRPKFEEGADSIRLLEQEIQKLAKRIYETEIFSDYGCEVIAERLKERTKQDHEQRHEFVRHQVFTATSHDDVIVVVYGSAHFGKKSPAPLEDAFRDCRIAVFQPHHTESNLLSAPNTWININNVQVNAVEAAVRKLLRSTDKPYLG